MTRPSPGLLLTGVALLLLAACRPQVGPREEIAKQSFSAAEHQALTPIRQRLLTNFELERTYQTLLSTDAPIAKRLPPDFRVDGFTRHGDASLSTALAWKLGEITGELAKEYVTRNASQVPCADTIPAETKCLDTFLDDFGLAAARRPLTREERDALHQIFLKGRELDQTYAGGLTWVVTALLQSPSLLYVSEIGAPSGTPTVHRLSGYEIASVLSYTLTGGPPDDELLKLAQGEELLSSSARKQEARRLLSKSDTRYQFRRFVTEWLEIDELESSSKDADVSSSFESLKEKMLAETAAFTDEVMVRHEGKLEAFLDAGFLSVDPALARYYGLNAWGPRVPSGESGRVGLLQHASFLAAHSLPNRTSPVKRGDFVLRRLLCVDLPRPEEVGIETVMPAPVKTKTTRELFTAHVQSKGCASCHDAIDPLGFTFENFDAAGHARTTENSQPVDSTAHFQMGAHNQRLKNSTDLARWLAREPVAQDCFRRHAVSFFSADNRPELARAMEPVSASLPDEKRASLLENLVAYVGSYLFVYRTVPAAEPLTQETRGSLMKAQTL